MQKIVWYNQKVPSTTEKKSVQIAVKLPESLYATIETICAAEDRPTGYVARELMIRGLGLYQRDGRLRDEAGMAPVVASISGQQSKAEIKRSLEKIEIGKTQRIPQLKQKAR